MGVSLSVIIPAYNSPLEVFRCLTSLQNTASKTIPIEFIVADDASPDVNFLEITPPCTAKVIRSQTNGGFGTNCNTGAAFAHGDILFFVNQDVRADIFDPNNVLLSQNWDIPVIEAFNDTSVGIVGTKLLFPDGRIQNAGGFYDGNCQPFHRGLGYSNHTYWEVNTPDCVSWTTGAALAIRRELFNQLGGFDPIYGKGYFEDVEICVKAREAGFKIWYEPRSIFVHSVGTSGGSSMFAKNAQTFKERWVDTKIIKPDISAIKERFW